MKKKLVAILLTAAMTLSLAACGGSGDTASSAPADDAAASTEEAAADDAAAADTEAATEEAAAEIDPNDPWAGWANVDTSEPVVINYLCVSDKPTNPDTDEMMVELNKILQEKVNATLELNYIGWTDYLANYNLTLAAMDGSVDLVVTADDWLDAWQNVDRGAFMEMPDEMIQTYAPATWQQVEEFGDWDMCRYTDGQIYLENDLFFAGQRPAVNVGLSVSRVGGDAQTKAMKTAAGALRLDLAQYREMEVFTQFSSDLDEVTKKQLQYGQGLMRLLRQPQYHPMQQHEQVVLLIAALNHVMQDVPVEKIDQFRSEYLAYMQDAASALCAQIDQTGMLSKEDYQSVLQLAKQFQQSTAERYVPQTR